MSLLSIYHCVGDIVAMSLCTCAGVITVTVSLCGCHHCHCVTVRVSSLCHYVTLRVSSLCHYVTVRVSSLSPCHCVDMPLSDGIWTGRVFLRRPSSCNIPPQLKRRTVPPAAYLCPAVSTAGRMAP